MSEKLNVRELVDSLGLEDLRKMKADLEGGGRHLNALVDEKIRMLENRPPVICATCGKDIDLQGEPYTLLFGPLDFKKKASFCAQDCLNYFLEQLKRMKEVQQ